MVFDVSKISGIGEYTVKPGKTRELYMKGDKVHYPDAEGDVYESLIDGNVWSPEAYPDGWKKQ